MSIEFEGVRPGSELVGVWEPLVIPELEVHVNTPEENFQNFLFMERNQERLIESAATLEDFRARIDSAAVLLRGSRSGKSGDGSQMSEDNIGYFYELGNQALELITKHAKGKKILERSDWSRLSAFKKHYKTQPEIKSN